MSKSKNTKRALLTSALSMVVCAALLIGTTFAWFTDSVTSSRNQIASGNLDVELYQVENGAETPVTADTNLFNDNALWEPGYAEAVSLKVANLGSLALEYHFSVNIVSEQGSVNVNGDEFKLSDYIKFAVIEGEKNYAAGDAGRQQALADAEAAGAQLISDLTVNNEGILYPKDAADTTHPSAEYITLVVYMPETVGNEANYRTGEAAPQITLGVNLMATQTPYEPDGFGDANYDAAAGDMLVSTEAELRNAIALGGHIQLTNNIALSGELYLKDVPALTLDGNGFALTAADGFQMNLEGQYNLVKVETGNAVTLQNITLEHAAIADAERSYHTLDIYGSPDVTLRDITLNRNFDSAPGGAAMVLNGSNVTVEGNLDITVGGSAWYGVNVDAETAASSLDIMNAAVSFTGGSLAFVLMENGGTVAYPAGNWLKYEYEAEGKKYTALLPAAASVDGQAYATIAEALAALDEGETFVLTSDTHEDVVIDDSNVTVKCAAGVTFDGILTLASGTSGIILDDFSLDYDYQDGDKKNPDYGNILINGNNQTLKNCSFVAKYNPDDSQAIGSNFGMVRINEGTGITIENCTFKTNTFSIFPAMKTGTITGCTFEPIDENRPLCVNYTGMQDVQFIGNTFKGLRLLVSSGASFEKNKFLDYTGTVLVESDQWLTTNVDLSGNYFGENPDFTKLIGSSGKVTVNSYYTDEAMTNLVNR